ncbi:hypothetical protein BDV59DRAFT_210986 [Aspergillus ambiguus]|uniref:oxidoreductase tpcG n=1 Tax=Aspergillus ambiguus TaxID=176160 RepID=UPI003CCE4562
MDPNGKRVPHSFALLGATGNTGRRVLRRLLQDTATSRSTFNAYVRSRAKIDGLFPDLSSDNRVTIFHGELTDEGLIRNCLSGVDTIICTLGENENIPGVRILQDCARVVIDVLTSLRAESSIEWDRPRLILLSSATWNPVFSAPRPALLDWMIRNAFARPYSDLVRAQNILLSAPSLVSVVLVQPNALVLESATGCVISTDFAHMAVSYEDLADGFVQVATIPKYRDIGAVGISSKRAANPILYAPFVMGKIFRGLLFQFVPGYWQAEYAISRFLTGLGMKQTAQ